DGAEPDSRERRGTRAHHRGVARWRVADICREALREVVEHHQPHCQGGWARVFGPEKRERGPVALCEGRATQTHRGWSAESLGYAAALAEAAGAAAVVDGRCRWPGQAASGGRRRLPARGRNRRANAEVAGGSR